MILDNVGVISSPLSLENGEGVFQGTNTGDRNLLFADSYIETKLIFADEIKSSRTDSVTNTFTSFSFVGLTDQKLNPLVRAELFVYTDYSKMGADIEFDFPRTTIKQFVTVNGFPVSVPKGLLLENTYDLNTKLLKGSGLHITPDFVEQIIAQGIPLKSGDIIEFIMTVEGRYDAQKLSSDGSVLRMYDGWIKGLNTSIAFRYYDPTELLLIRAGLSGNPSEIPSSTGCPDINSNGICDSDDPTIVQVQTVDSNTNTVTSDTSVESSPIQTQIAESYISGEPIFNNMIPEEPITLPNGDSSSIYTNEDAIFQSNGINVAVEELGSGSTEEIALTILNTVQQKQEGDDNAVYGFIVMGVAITSFAIYFVIKKVRNR